jgi:uncharacterized protein involved in exopolysaccharide biosynthesis
MDEYEVDLRDYLVVIWRWKWLVFGITVLAMIAAAAASLLAPNQYQAKAVLGVESPREDVLRNYTPPSQDILVSELRGFPGMEEAARASGLERDWLSGHLSVKRSGPLIDISLKGDRPPEKLVKALNTLIDRLDSRLKSDVADQLAREKEEVTAEINRLSQELTDWQKRAAQVRDKAASEREAIRAAIDDIRSQEEFLTADLGDRITGRAYLTRKELDTLFARLQAIELELDGLERLGPLALPGGASRIPSLEAALKEDKLELARLEELLASPPSPLVLIQPPAASSAIRPSLKMNLAVAAVLGLLLGVLAAFVANWFSLPGESARDGRG